jgi:hypothetical protein
MESLMSKGGLIRPNTGGRSGQERYGNGKSYDGRNFCAHGFPIGGKCNSCGGTAKK